MPIPRRVELKKPDGTELSETEREKLRRELDKREVGKLPSMRVLKPLLGDAEASLIRSGEEAHYRIIRDTLKRKKWEARLNIPGLNPDRQADLAEALSSGETRLDKSDRLGLPQRTTPDDVVQFVMSTLTSTAPAGAAWGTTPWSDYRDHVYTTHTAIRRIPDGYAAEIVRVIHGTPRGRPAEVPLSNYAQATENAMKIRHNVGQIHTDREAAAFIDLLRGLGHEPMGGPVPTGIPELVGRTSEGAPSGHQEALSKLEPVDAMHVRALQRPLSQLPKGFMEKEPTQIPNPATPPLPPMIASTSPTAGQYENKIARELFARGYTDQEIQAAADTYTDTTATPLISKVLREGHWGKHCKKYLSVGLAAVLAISGFLGRGCSIRSSRLAEQQRIIRETEEAEKAKTAAAEAAKKTEAEKAKQDAEKKVQDLRRDVRNIGGAGVNRSKKAVDDLMTGIGGVKDAETRASMYADLCDGLTDYAAGVRDPALRGRLAGEARAAGTRAQQDYDSAGKPIMAAEQQGDIAKTHAVEGNWAKAAEGYRGQQKASTAAGDAAGAAEAGKTAEACEAAEKAQKTATTANVEAAAKRKTAEEDRKKAEETEAAKKAAAAEAEAKKAEAATQQTEPAKKAAELKAEAQKLKEEAKNQTGPKKQLAELKAKELEKQAAEQDKKAAETPEAKAAAENKQRATELRQKADGTQEAKDAKKAEEAAATAEQKAAAAQKAAADAIKTAQKATGTTPPEEGGTRPEGGGPKVGGVGENVKKLITEARTAYDSPWAVDARMRDKFKDSMDKYKRALELDPNCLSTPQDRVIYAVTIQNYIYLTEQTSGTIDPEEKVRLWREAVDYYTKARASGDPEVVKRADQGLADGIKGLWRGNPPK